jgi:hypothetical protein
MRNISAALLDHEPGQSFSDNGPARPFAHDDNFCEMAKQLSLAGIQQGHSWTPTVMPNDRHQSIILQPRKTTARRFALASEIGGSGIR